MSPIETDNAICAPEGIFARQGSSYQLWLQKVEALNAEPLIVGAYYQVVNSYTGEEVLFGQKTDQIRQAYINTDGAGLACLL